jgi:hypothetical protein
MSAVAGRPRYSDRFGVRAGDTRGGVSDRWGGAHMLGQSKAKAGKLPLVACCCRWELQPIRIQQPCR